MSAPIRYSGTAAIVIAAAAATATGSPVRKQANTSTPSVLSSTIQERSYHHQQQDNCCLPPHGNLIAAKGGDLSNNFQLLKNTLQLEKVSEQQNQQQQQQGEQQQQQQQLQRKPEEVVPHQLIMSSSVDDSVVTPVKSMEVVTSMDEVQSEGGNSLCAGASDLGEAKLQGTEKAQHYPVEVQTEWRGTSDDEGRFGTPGAAGLDYQNYQLQEGNEQQQTSDACSEKINSNQASNGTDDHPMDQSTITEQPSQTMEASALVEEELMEPGIDARNPTIFNNNINGNMEQEIKAMTTEKLYNTLKEYNALQDKYHTVLLLPKESKVSSKYNCNIVDYHS